MAHTLNEQVIVIPAGTGDTNIELILDAIVQLTGWYRDGYTIYCDDAHTMGVKFAWTAGSSSCRVEGFFNGSTELDYVSSYGVAAGVTLRAQISADESVTFLDCGHANLQFIHTKNSAGTDLLYQTTNNAYCLCGSPTMAEKISVYMPYNTTGKTYCITKMPDVINGEEIPSLYMVVGTASPAAYNQLVSFDGTVFRIVFFGTSYSTSQLAFAFPVSD